MDIRRRLMMKALNSSDIPAVPDVPDTPDVPTVPDTSDGVLPYIEADGLSYVDTDIAFSSEFATINVLYGKEPNSSSSGCVLTFHNGDANLCMLALNGVKGLACRRPSSDGTRVIVEHDKTSSIQNASYIIATMYMDQSQGHGSYFSTFTTPVDMETLPYGEVRCYSNYLETPANYTNTTHLHILGNRSGAPAPSGVKFVRITIKNYGGELLHDLIPVRLDGQLGIKDTITGKFFPFITH